MSGSIADNAGRGSGVIAAAGGGGKVLQVVQTFYNGTASSSSSTYASVSGFSADITPSATSSNVLVSVSANFGGDISHFAGIIVKRGSTAIGSSTIGTGNQPNTFLKMSHPNAGNENERTSDASKTFLDTGISTTSATTYQVYFARLFGSGTVYLNRASSFSDVTWAVTCGSVITLMEISA